MKLRFGEIKEAIVKELKNQHEASMRPSASAPAASVSGLRSAVSGLGTGIENDDPQVFWSSLMDVMEGLKAVAGRAPGPSGVEASKNFVDALNIAMNVAKRQIGRR